VRRERLAILGLAVILVLCRALPATYYEGFFFDSDQAIVGLMAKHLSEGRTFPLYYYGQNYMLGVQAWLIAPVFAIARPTVAAMRAPLVALNLAVAVWMLVAFQRRFGLRPAMALIAILPFVVPTPAMASELLDASGASVELVVYTLILWSLRRRPVPFAVVFAIAFMHREIMIVAPAALAIADIASGERFWISPRRIGTALLAGAIVWLVVDDVKMHMTGVGQAMQLASLGNQMCVDAQLPARFGSVLREALPIAYGARPMMMQWFRMNSPLHTGSNAVGILIGLLAAVMLVRLIGSMRTGARNGVDASARGLPVYLMATGIFSALIYPLSCNVSPGSAPLLRYLVLTPLIPIGLFLAFAVRERSARLRALVAGGYVLWAAANVVDNARVINYAVQNPPLSEHRVLTNYLLEQGVRYAEATYWDAYVIDFLSRERLTVGSFDTFRIPEYERAVDEHRADVVYLERLPCSGYATVASWCIHR
jgi:hypothetical protein